MFETKRGVSPSAIELIRQKLSIVSFIPKEIEVESMEHIADYCVRVTLREFMFKHIPEIRVPKDWWQHFKLRWVPKFILRWCPVKYTVYDAWSAFPSLGVKANRVELFEYEDGGIELRLLRKRESE